MSDTFVPAAPPLRFDLEVQPEARDIAWHACLREHASGERAEFDSPLALLRHLVQRTCSSHPQGGLQ
jgi:hypothetical protein